MIENIIAMSQTTPINIAIQKNGRLTELSLKAFKEQGIELTHQGAKNIYETNHPNITFYMTRNDSIPRYVQAEVGKDKTPVAHFGIIGTNTLKENYSDLWNLEVVETIQSRQCRLAMIFKEDEMPKTMDELSGKKYATSYKNMLRRYFIKNGIDAQIVESTGGTEMDLHLGLVDGVADLVDTGNTLREYGLAEYDPKRPIDEFKTVVIANENFLAQNGWHRSPSGVYKQRALVV